MAYTVKDVAKFSGVSIRTLRFYDELGLLKPAYYGENGYRYYEEQQLLMLQQILFFRALGFELKKIQEMMGDNGFDQLVALRKHQITLEEKILHLNTLLLTVKNTINHLEGKVIMNPSAFF